MKITLKKDQCCHDGGRVVDEIESNDLKELAGWLIDSWNGFDDNSCVIWDLQQAKSCYGDEMPKELAGLLANNPKVIEFISCGVPEYHPYTGHQQVIDELTSAGWPDIVCSIE